MGAYEGLLEYELVRECKDFSASGQSDANQKGSSKVAGDQQSGGNEGSQQEKPAGTVAKK